MHLFSITKDAITKMYIVNISAIRETMEPDGHGHKGDKNEQCE